MTCTDVREIIEVLPVTEWSRHQRERVQRHAHNCTGCQSALTAANALDSSLKRLPEPALPENLASGIKARMARVSDERIAQEAVAVANAGSRTSASRVPMSAGRDMLSWVAALGGIAVGFGTQVYRIARGGGAIDLTSSRVGEWGGLLAAPDASASTLLVAIGLSLYFAGFLALLMRANRKRDYSTK
ncbi:MAG: hypothetical protein OXL36_06165 [Bryobacterales bacterium]|nr:hypothetical protein [Bryobacterales bacterium]MDE0292992.1 hypothetical protein [Bryobacterales bacterium]